MGVDWGDVPTWVNAAVTAGALLFAGIAVIRSGALLKVEQNRDRRRDAEEAERRAREEQAEQADSVAAWPAQEVRPDSGRVDGARVTNGSRLPVWDTTVTFYGPRSGRRAEVTMPVLPPGSEFVPWPEDLRLSNEQDVYGSAIYTESPAEFTVDIRFRDAAGRQWKRSQQGVVTKTGIVIFGELATNLPLPTAEFHVNYVPPAGEDGAPTETDV